MNITSWINEQVVMSVMRWLIDKAGFALIASGWLTHDQATTAGGAVLALVMLAVQIISARTKHIALAAAGGGDVVAGKAIVRNAKVTGSL